MIENIIKRVIATDNDDDDDDDNDLSDEVWSDDTRPRCWTRTSRQKLWELDVSCQDCHDPFNGLLEI